jgi:large subunit ribosomal protein L10
MPTDAKRRAVSDLAEMLRDSSALAVADYRGLTVSEMHTVRRTLRANGVSLKVAKNRLLKIAAEDAGLAELKSLLDGPTAIAATTGDEVSLARALQDAFRPYKVVTLRGGLLGGQPVSAADLQRLASLPGREVLLARLAGGMAAPLTGMAGVLAANLRNLIGVLSAVAEQRRESEIAAPSEPTAPAPESDQTGSPESAESTDQTASAEPTDETESTDQTASAEPTDETEFTDQTASAEPTEVTEQTEQAESNEQTASAENAELTEQTEATETADQPATDKENE